jgi:hypothetical protein
MAVSDRIEGTGVNGDDGHGEFLTVQKVRKMARIIRKAARQGNFRK